ncbi:MAG: DUF4340 domain-containing protein [Alcanivoracaceae bacterium]|nr:DUF4340 domain-containing protein [Alcanivoracaceae bacterium]
MQNNLKLLLGLLVILLMVSYFILQNKGITTNEETQMLVPELKDLINEVDGIVISKNDKTVTLNKQDGIWRIAEVDDFMADTNKIATLLLDLRKFSLKDKKTSNIDNYGKLSLAESGEHAASRILLKNASSQFADIFIGKQAHRSQGTYVRKNTESQTWLADGVLNLKLDSSYWIVNTILDIDGSMVKSVTFKPVDSVPFNINKLTPNDQGFVLGNMPAGMQLKSTIDLNSLANGLQKFSIESAATKTDISDDMLVISVIYQLFSGMTYQLDLFKQDENRLMRIRLENLDGNSKFAQQLENWTFTIPGYKFNALNKKLEDMIEGESGPVDQVATSENED